MAEQERNNAVPDGEENQRNNEAVRPNVAVVSGNPVENNNGAGGEGARPLVGAVAPSRNLNPQHIQRGGLERGLPQPQHQALGQIGAEMPGVRPGALYNWQATKATMRDRLKYLFNNEVLSDVRFIVGRGVESQRIPAHKLILSMGSAVFDAMFNSSLATLSNEVELPDVEPAAFRSLLRFLYTDEVDIGPESVMQTLYTAKKYAVPTLESHCVDFLKKNLSPDNAFMLLTQARLFDEPQLATLCLDCIDKNTREALTADGFTDIDYNTLLFVLERDTLGVSESSLFPALERWSEAECWRQELESTKEHKRKVLGEAISLVRFPLMTVEEFAQGPAQSGLLSDGEALDLFLYYTLNPKPRVRFSDRPRCSLTGKEQSVMRFRGVAERWGYSGTSDRIRFSVNRKIYIVGFGLYGAISGPSDFQVNIQIISIDTVLGQNDTGFSCDGSDKTFRVMFKQPIEIKPNQNYIASVTLNGYDSYYGIRGCRRVTKDTPNDGQTVFIFAFAPGNNNGTSVEDGQIPELIYYT